MSTFVSWQIAIGLVVVVWLVIGLLKKTALRRIWRPRLRVIDLMVPVFWWGLSAITYQVWRQGMVPTLLLALTLWGIALALWQGFVRENFVQRAFWLTWWRIVGITSLVAFVAMAVLAFIQTK